MNDVHGSYLDLIQRRNYHLIDSHRESDGSRVVLFRLLGAYSVENIVQVIIKELSSGGSEVEMTITALK